MQNFADFGSWLRRARGARDLTQEALAEAVGCATQTIRSFEIGRRRPSREMAVRIAVVLDLPIDEREALLRLARVPLATRESDTADPSDSVLPLALAASRPSVEAPTSLIGRQQELQQLGQALLAERQRLVTLLGPGGIGKTQLARQIGVDLMDQFADGTTFVALAPVTDTANLITAIAEAVGCPLSAAPSPRAALGDFLHDRELLMILDNFEQLLGQGQVEHSLAVLTDLLAAAPGLQLLVTSRERLRLNGEWVIAVDGLALPHDRPGAAVERSPAALLFLERARFVDRGFAITPHNRADLIRICRLLGGVPLAIELAAAWVRVLSCSEIAAEVARDADVLRASSRDLPSRHRSLGAVLDHSWQLLTAEERRLLTHLSVFQGGCSREAICAVLGGQAGGAATLLLPLASLVDKSLVRRMQGVSGVTRYDLHEFVRQYGAARLAEDPAAVTAAADRHATYYATWLAAQEIDLKSTRQRMAGEAITVEIANVRAAWRWASTHQDAATVRRMLPALDWFYELRGWYDEAAAAFAQATEDLGRIDKAVALEPTQACYWLVYGRAGFHTLRRDPVFAVRRLAESVSALRRVSRSGEQLHCLKGLAYVKMFAGDYAGAETLLDEARALAVAQDDAWNLAMTLVVRGVMETLRSDASTARRHLTEALSIARMVGDPRPVSMALTYLGLTVLTLGDDETAERSIREAHLLAVEHQDRFQISLALQAFGRVALARGEHVEAGWLLGESLAIARETGDRWLEAQGLGCLAELAAAQGQLARARQGRRAALAVAAAAPVPIALDELAALAALEIDEHPTAALATLAYVRCHPLTRPATRASVERHWLAASSNATPDQLAAAEAAAVAVPLNRPVDLLDLLGLR